MAIQIHYFGAPIYWTTAPRSSAYTHTKQLLDTMLKLRIIKKTTYDHYFFLKGHF